MSRIGIGYEIGRFTGVCAATGEPLAPGSPCVATLSEAVGEDGAPSEGFVRQDFAPEAWEAGHRPDHLFSYWRTLVPHSDAPRRLLVDDGVLLDLVARLEGDERPTRLAFRFVLALILLRRRQLRQLGRARTTIHRPRRLDARPTASEASAEHAASPDGASVGVDLPGAASNEPVDVEVWLLLPRGAAEGETPLRVIDPGLGPEDVATIAEQLGEVLQGEL